MELFGYLDAGSVSMVLTAILGGVAGLIATLKMYGKRAFRTLVFWKDHDSDEGEQAPPITETGEHKAAK